MVAALQRLSASLGWNWASEFLDQTRSFAHDDVHKVGEFYADYSELSAEELSAATPEMDALLKRSTVVSVKRGL